MAVNRTKVLEAAQKFLSKGQYDKAVSEYQKLVNEDPRDVRTLLKIGDLHTRRNKPRDAIDVYHKVADLYAKQGFFLKAVAVYKQILKLDPGHLDSTQRLAKMYEELALTSDALSTYELVADGYIAQGQMPKALETMERMIELDGQNVAVRIKYAEALSKAGKQREAAQAFAAGAALLKEQGRMDDYVRVVERQLYHDPDNVGVARELSGLYLERSDPKRALAKLQICFKADPRDLQTLEMLAEAFRQLGQTAKTISVLKEIARLHGEAGSEEPRRRTLKRVLELDPNDAEAKQVLSAPAAAAPARSVPAGRPTAAPPRRGLPQPPPPPAPSARGSSEGSEEIELEAAEELDLIEEGESDDVLIVDEPLGARSNASAGLPPPPTIEDRVLTLLADADAREGAGDYEGAVEALQGVLELDASHVEAHERLKDIFIAADRRVDAVKELLWLSGAWEEHNRDRALHYAESAFELAPRSEATRRRLSALGIELPGEPSRAHAAGGPISVDAELDAILPPVEREPLSTDLLLELPISPDEFDAAPPVRRQSFALERAAQLLELELSPEEFEAEPRSLAAEFTPTDLPSLEFPTVGTHELSVASPSAQDVSASSREEVRLEQPGKVEQTELLLLTQRRAAREAAHGFEAAAPTATHDQPPLDDGGAEPTIPDESVLDLLLRADAQAEQAKAAQQVASHTPEPRPTSEPRTPPEVQAAREPQTRAVPHAPELPVSESGSRAVLSSLAAEQPTSEIQELLEEADFFVSQGLLEEALDVVQEAILIYPSDATLKRRLAEYQAKVAESASQRGRAKGGIHDESFDIAEQLASELAQVESPADGEQMIDVESVFAQFKKGVAEQIAPDDSETHFDLGIAYKEMGLTDDAVGEFELAAKSKRRACTAMTMIGMCHLERGDAQVAITYFERALSAEQRAPAEELALNYEIGNAYERLGQLDKALAAFEKAAARDRSFRGVASRLEQLKKRGVKSAHL